jgi:ketosteroid isomerase-like protein
VTAGRSGSYWAIVTHWPARRSSTQDPKSLRRWYEAGISWSRRRPSYGQRCRRRRTICRDRTRWKACGLSGTRCLITTPTTDETEWSNGVFGPTFASFDEFALRIDRIHDAGGVVVFEGRVTGLTKADGRPDAPTAWLWTVRDGRIVAYHNNDLE